ncbi:hypothetical protein Rt10032_c01g0372 [Rhodotorula toruloides]|uniref:Uncharacterized protein n=1 Tax=Rhodotorula toruloides TaxID=5286 RepID=A0A511K8M7_RHOTO|nr:hypothetical protein Rt10032_c01g0372 [Rhodotorula toruloides]
MSRYAQRRADPNRYLSALKHQQPKRGVVFGENEVEEFNGSEAPDAIVPARSSSRMGMSPAPSDGRRYLSPSASAPAQQGIGRPRSTSIDGRRSAQPFLPPPPPPPRLVVSDARYSMMPPPVSTTSSVRGTVRPPSRDDRSYGRPPTSFARSSNTYPSEEDDVRPFGSDPEDDDDAFTAVATGVATDLDMEPPTRREDPRERLVAVQHQQQPSTYSTYLAVPRPPSRGVQVRRGISCSPIGGGPPDHPLDRQSPNSHARFASVHTHWPPPTSASGYDSSDFDYPDDIEPPAGLLLRQRHLAGMRSTPPVSEQRGIARPVSSASARMQVDDYDSPPPPPPPPYRSNPAAPPIERYERPPHANAAARRAAQRDLPEDSPVEKELIALLKELQFSLALKDFHDALSIGVQKTLVAEDGMGHAYCKVHCKRLPRHEDIEREVHLKQHWVPIAGSRWEFRTTSHRVTVVFKTAALAAYEAQFLTRR